MSRAIAVIPVTLLGGCMDWGVTQIPPEEVPEVDSDTGITGEQPDDKVPDDVPTGGVAGRICAPSQHVYVANAKVSIEHQYGVSTTFTDADGYFLLEGIPGGEYQVIVQKGTYHTQFAVVISPNEITELAEEECVEADLNIAVVSGMYDQIEAIITDLGLEYDGYNGLSSQATTFLKDPAEMEKYDIIFFNCGLEYGYMLDDMDEIAQNLQDYVANGGSVYASDWAYYLVEASWPDMVDFRGTDSELFEPAVGRSGTIDANVLDADMIAALSGSTTAEIRYDLEYWITPTATGGGSGQMVNGTYKYFNSSGGTSSASGPLAVKLATGDGAVIYTTFHNEAQITLDMEFLLREIIWAL